MTNIGGTDPSLLHLLHLVSPALPVGAYAYSQGLEMAVEKEWVNDGDSARDWIENLMRESLAYLDVPLLQRQYRAWTGSDTTAVYQWNQFLLASRESKELLLEDTQMGRALCRLLGDLEVPGAQQWLPEESPSFVSQFALAASHYGVRCDAASQGFVWSWLENQIAAAVKLVPLGQTLAQQLLVKLMPVVGDVCERAGQLTDDQLGNSLPRLALASMQHEEQYSRLFRS